VANYIKKLDEKEQSDAQTTTSTTVTTTISVEEAEEEVVCLDDGAQSSVVSAPFGNNLQVLPLLLFTTLANRYNLIDCLESLKPKYLILYHSDIASTRVIEVSILLTNFLT
jgi:hypothetical protein